jgi:hypothetical protein
MSASRKGLRPVSAACLLSRAHVTPALVIVRSVIHVTGPPWMLCRRPGPGRPMPVKARSSPSSGSTPTFTAQPHFRLDDPAMRGLLMSYFACGGTGPGGWLGLLRRR